MWHNTYLFRILISVNTNQFQMNYSSLIINFKVIERFNLKFHVDLIYSTVLIRLKFKLVASIIVNGAFAHLRHFDSCEWFYRSEPAML